METIITASGREFATDYVAVIPRPEMAFIRVLNSTLVEIATVFGNPEETKKIRYQEHILSGYTLSAIAAEGEAFKIELVR